MSHNDSSESSSLAVTQWLGQEPSVAHFNTVAEARQGKQHSKYAGVMAAVLGLVGQEVQDMDGGRFILGDVQHLRCSTVLLSIGDGTMTVAQLLATPHMAALVHLGVPGRSHKYIMVPVDPTDFETVKQIFTALAAECKLSLWPPSHTLGSLMLLCFYI